MNDYIFGSRIFARRKQSGLFQAEAVQAAVGVFQDVSFAERGFFEEGRR